MTPIRNLAALLLGVVLAPGFAIADVSAKAFEYPYDVVVYDLPVSTNGVRYRLYVRPPLREPADGEDPSTFYFLDALANFVPAAAMTSNFEHFNYTPAAYFVGIGYYDEGDGVPKEHNRTRDYTPTEFTPPEQGHFLSGSPGSYEGSGGADAFLDVVEQEIVPFIESRYTVDANDRVLVGASLGGLAAVHSLLTRPGMFRRYVILSPSIWWDDWFMERGERYVMRTARETAKVDYPVETRAYFAVGDTEERFGLVTDLYVLANALRSRHNDRLKVHLEVLEDQLHEGIFPTGFMKGIVGVYSGDEKRRPSASKFSW